MSTLMFIVYFGNVLTLSYDSNYSGDAQGFLEMAIYASTFAGALYFVELIHGVGAMKNLDQEYPYSDNLLLPSILYRFGILEHKERLTA